MAASTIDLYTHVFICIKYPYKIDVEIFSTFNSEQSNEWKCIKKIVQTA